jgi:uncharacterized membrane protein
MLVGRNARDAHSNIARARHAGGSGPIGSSKAEFPAAAGIFFGLGTWRVFRRNYLSSDTAVASHGHQCRLPPDTIENLEFNTFLDGLFHAATYIFVVLGLLLLWRTAHRGHLWWSGKMLAGTMLIGFGIFNLVEGLVDHHLLGLHHVNETAPREAWIWWDVAFLAWGAIMLVAGWMLCRTGRRLSPRL